MGLSHSSLASLPSLACASTSHELPTRASNRQLRQSIQLPPCCDVHDACHSSWSVLVYPLSLVHGVPCGRSHDEPLVHAAILSYFSHHTRPSLLTPTTSHSALRSPTTSQHSNKHPPSTPTDKHDSLAQPQKDDLHAATALHCSHSTGPLGAQEVVERVLCKQRPTRCCTFSWSLPPHPSALLDPLQLLTCGTRQEPQAD